MRLGPHVLRKVTSAVAFAILLAGIFWGGAQPAAAGLVPEPFDKLLHAALYGALALLLLGGLGVPAWTTFVLVVSIGATDEWRQLGLSGRSGSVLDLGADAVGATCALVTLSAMRRVVARKGVPKDPD